MHANDAMYGGHYMNIEFYCTYAYNFKKCFRNAYNNNHIAELRLPKLIGTWVYLDN